MKKCSKCKRELDEVNFVKSNRYKDGFYPSCKDCRAARRIQSLSEKAMCVRCESKPHIASNFYCYDCDRIVRGRAPTPKFRRDPHNKTMCSRCKVEPRLQYHNYCSKCKNEVLRQRADRLGGWWSTLTPEQKHKATVRAFINHLVKRGVLVRKPCEVCGSPSEHHHLDYESRTLNVRYLCRKHHVEEEKRKKLTSEQS